MMDYHHAMSVRVRLFRPGYRLSRRPTIMTALSISDIGITAILTSKLIPESGSASLTTYVRAAMRRNESMRQATTFSARFAPEMLLRGFDFAAPAAMPRRVLT
eukprot:391013-Rhodomonas_salina.2